MLGIKGITEPEKLARVETSFKICTCKPSPKKFIFLTGIGSRLMSVRR